MYYFLLQIDPVWVLAVIIVMVSIGHPCYCVVPKPRNRSTPNLRDLLQGQGRSNYQGQQIPTLPVPGEQATSEGQDPIATDDGVYVELAINNTDKRSQVEPFSSNMDLPWTCAVVQTWRDLGREYFPRYVREVVCGQSNCFYGHYICRPHSYQLKVLRRGSSRSRSKRDIIDTRDAGMSVNWVTEDIQVGIGCDCAR